MILRVLRAIKKPDHNPEFEALVFHKLLHIELLRQELEASRALLAAKQRALYCGQTLEDVLDKDWMKKPRKGLKL